MTLRLSAISSPGEIRVALSADDELLDFALWRPGRPDAVGALHRGRIDSVLPALGGAFVALGPPGHETGFLPLRETNASPGVGDPVVVRINRSAQGGKGPRLVLDRTPIDPATPVGQIEPGPDPLRRLAELHPEASITVDDPSVAAMLPSGLRARTTVRRDPWSPAIIASVAALEETEIALPGGMRASIHPTPALVAIDMDGGGTSSGRGGKATVQFAANRAAIGPLLHQLRLRALGGAILIDLAGLHSRRRAVLRPEIEAALARDPAGPQLLGFTALGLVEIVRPRIHPPLHELLRGPHAAALRALAAAAREVDAPPHRLPGLVLGLDVATALETDRFARAALERRAGRPLAMRIDPALPRLGWRLDHG